MAIVLAFLPLQCMEKIVQHDMKNGHYVVIIIQLPATCNSIHSKTLQEQMMQRKIWMRDREKRTKQATARKCTGIYYSGNECCVWCIISSCVVIILVHSHFIRILYLGFYLLDSLAWMLCATKSNAFSKQRHSLRSTERCYQFGVFRFFLALSLFWESISYNECLYHNFTLKIA